MISVVHSLLGTLFMGNWPIHFSR